MTRSETPKRPEASRDDARLSARYARIEEQLATLFEKVEDPLSRMATSAALLHAKMPHFFWTGYYRLVDGELLVGPYQGSIACMRLERGKGVCWAAVQAMSAQVVPDVHAFEGHIACDARSKSEVVLPVRDGEGRITAVLDVDSDRLDSFRPADVEGLARITALIHAS